MMRAVMQKPTTQRRVNLVLKERADRFTGDDLLRITEAAGEAGAILHITLHSWQVFVGVPTVHQAQLMGNLREMGYESVKVVSDFSQGFTLGAGPKNEATL